MSRNDGPIQRSDIEYALILMGCFRNWLESRYGGDSLLRQLLPRDVTKGYADRGEVLESLAFVTAILTSHLHNERIDKALHSKEVWHDRSSD